MMGLAIKCMASEPLPSDGLVRTLRALSLSEFGSAAMRERRRRRLGPLSRKLAVGLIALLVAAQAWLWHIDRDPGIAVPQPRMPSQNAFAHFKAAGLALVKEKEVGGALIGSTDEPRATSAPGPAVQERLVAENTEALRLLRRGFAYEYREPPVRSFDQTFPHYARDRALARLLALEAQVHEHRGRIAAANSSDLDAVELGMRIRRGGTVIGALVGCACSAIGRIGLWRRLDRMSAGDARAALARLERIEKLRVPVADLLEEDMWAGVASLEAYMRDPRWRWKVGEQLMTDNPLGQSRGVRSWGVYLALLPFSKRDIVDRYVRSMSVQVQTGRQYPVPLPDARMDTLDPLNRVLLPVYDGIITMDACERALTGLLRVSLAVRIYNVEQGRPPRRWRDLVPGVLRQWPADPFSREGHGLSAVWSAGQPVIYSVGPDGVGDGGAAMGERMAGGRVSRAVRPDSVGDIVAGVNVP